jgi:hypothetical protein
MKPVHLSMLLAELIRSSSLALRKATRLFTEFRAPFFAAGMPRSTLVYLRPGVCRVAESECALEIALCGVYRYCLHR